MVVGKIITLLVQNTFTHFKIPLNHVTNLLEEGTIHRNRTNEATEKRSVRGGGGFGAK